MTKVKHPSSAMEGEEWFYLSLHEITYSLGVAPEMIIEIINEGIISINSDEHEQWQFDNQAYRRIQTVLRLNRDLGVNVPGAALILELLSEIDRLQSLVPLKKRLSQ